MKICCVCGKEHSLVRRKTCSDECLKKIKGHTDEVKKRLSIKRKEYLSQNKNKHNWSLYKNIESDPEQKFRKFISKTNKNIVQYFVPPGPKNYELDFADIKNKIAFEINGNQHYTTNGELASYYQSRHDYFVSLGWDVVEIHYSLCYDEDQLKEIVYDAYNGNIDLSQKTKQILNYRKRRKEEKEQEKKRRKEEKEQEKYREIKEKIDYILKSNIDFSKFGWVTKVAQILKITTPKVNGWMKRNMFDFYENKCFKRKASVPQRSSKS